MTIKRGVLTRLSSSGLVFFLLPWCDSFMSSHSRGLTSLYPSFIKLWATMEGWASARSKTFFPSASSNKLIELPLGLDLSSLKVSVSSSLLYESL
ncbi:hypothetical protein D3C84_1095760 [compost metagenome]